MRDSIGDDIPLAEVEAFIEAANPGGDRLLDRDQFRAAVGKIVSGSTAAPSAAAKTATTGHNSFERALIRAVGQLNAGQPADVLFDQIDREKFKTIDAKIIVRRLGAKAPNEAMISRSRWHIVTIVVDAQNGTLKTYVDGMPCMSESDWRPADLVMHAKLSILGGGKEAEARGGQLRKMHVHNAAMCDEDVQDLYLALHVDNPLHKRSVRNRSCVP